MRGAGFMEPDPITHLDILAWSVLRDMKLESWEVDALLSLDLARREVFLDRSGHASD